MPRETRNSQDASLLASSCPASSATDSHSFSDGTTAISPNVVAQIVAAVKASLATEKELSLEQVSSPVSSAHSSLVVVSNSASSYLSLGAVQPITNFALWPFWPLAAPCLWLLLLRVHLQVCNPLLFPHSTFSAPVSLTPATASLFRASPSVSHLCPGLHLIRCTPNFDIQHKVSP